MRYDTERISNTEYTVHCSLFISSFIGTGIPVASVAAGFPAGQTPLELRLKEIEYAVAQGAKEIDIVVTRGHVLHGNWEVCDMMCDMMCDVLYMFVNMCG